MLGIKNLDEILLVLCMNFLSVFTEQELCPVECFCPPFENKVNCERTKYRSIPQHLPKTTKSLSLSHNPITQLNPKDFEIYADLEEIFLHNNTIEDISPYTFSELKNLKQISIRNNPLKRLKKFSFGKIRSKNRVKLYLSKNDIEIIERHAFDDSENFQTIDLRWNPLKVIQHRAFSNLYNVVYLELPEGIQDIEQEAFNNLTRVHVVQLSGLNLANSSLRKHTFRGLHRCSGIFIENSELGTISSQAFAGLKTVEEIRISNSEIHRIRRRGFDNMAHVGQLNLVNNRINRLDNNFISHIPSDTEVKLEKNRFNCSCENMWLLETEEVSEKTLRNNYCQFPKILENLSLIEIKEMNQGYLDNCSVFVFEDSGAAKIRLFTNYVIVIFVFLLPFHALSFI